MTNPTHLAVQAAELYQELIKFMKGYSETYDDRVHATWLIQQALTQAWNAGKEEYANKLLEIQVHLEKANAALENGAATMEAYANERLEQAAQELEAAFEECNTLNLLHGAARIRQLLIPSDGGMP
jgi:exonuclease VII small subunit